MTTPDLERLAREDARREEARRLYCDSDLSVTEIAAKLNMSLTTLYRWCRTGDWPKRAWRYGGKLRAPRIVPPVPVAGAAPIDVGQLKQRLYRALNRNLDIMESRMTSQNGVEGADPGREIQTLGTAVRTAERLHDIPDGTQRTDTAAARKFLLTPEEEERLALQIADRIAKIVVREQSAGGHPRGG